MKPKEKKPATVFRIISRDTGAAVGSYSRAYHDEFDFESVEQAREANVHGVFKDKSKYAIAKYRVIYELIEPDCDSGRLTVDKPDGYEEVEQILGALPPRTSWEKESNRFEDEKMDEIVRKAREAFIRDVNNLP